MNALPFYICNKEKYCAIEGGCGEDMCNHTCDIHFAKNEDAIKIFEDFKKRFDLTIYDGVIYATEKED